MPPIPYLEVEIPMPNVKAQVAALKDAKASHEKALADYRAMSATKTAPELEAQSALVKSSAEAIVSAITMGCEACPGCKEMPHGIEQPGKRGTFEYEIGCLSCRPFEHTDGTRREYRVRGGLIPSHAVDAWNLGPDFWLIEVPPEVKATSVPEKEAAPE